MSAIADVIILRFCSLTRSLVHAWSFHTNKDRRFKLTENKFLPFSKIWRKVVAPFKGRWDSSNNKLLFPVFLLKMIKKLILRLK